MKKKMSVYSIIGSILNTILTVVVVFMIAVVGIGALSKPGEKSFMGLSSLNVMTDSMKGDYFKGGFPSGSLIITKYTPAEKLKVGDVLTYKVGKDEPGNKVDNLTHRIIKVNNQDGHITFITQGDANNVPDGAAVEPDQIVGKVLFAVPMLGSAMVDMNNRYFLVCAVVLTALLFLVPYIVKDDKKNKKEKIDEQNS